MDEPKWAGIMGAIVTGGIAGIVWHAWLAAFKKHPLSWRQLCACSALGALMGYAVKDAVYHYAPNFAPLIISIVAANAGIAMPFFFDLFKEIARRLVKVETGKDDE